MIYRRNGKVVSREDFQKGRKSNWLEVPPMVPNTYTEHDPLLSEGCGVMKSQVGEAREMIKRHNIQGAAVLPSGKLRFTSRRARKEFLNRRGFVDNQAGYGD